MRHGRWITAALAVVLAGGCAQQGETNPGEAGHDGDPLQRQARAALERYDRAVAAAGGVQGIVVVGERTGQVGTWEDDRPMFKEALLAGKVAAVAALPAAPQPQGTVVWDGGGSRTVAIIAAGAALAELVKEGSGSCPECATIEVTGARLATARIQTARGGATAPAWEFTLRGSGVLVTRVAFAASAGVTVVPPPWDASNPPDGLSIEAARIAGATLTVEFVGAPKPAAEPCGADYTAEAVESAAAVVVIVRERRHAGDDSCDLIGAGRTATVELAAPLGDRAVLEVRQGRPVPVTTG